MAWRIIPIYQGHLLFTFTFLLFTFLLYSPFSIGYPASFHAWVPPNRATASYPFFFIAATQLALECSSRQEQ
jgi:hypothetical protein